MSGDRSIRRSAAVIAGVVAFAIAPVPAASAAVTETATFSSTGGEQTFLVPAGVTEIHVRAVGGKGATAFNGAGNAGVGAFGGFVEADLSVVPGQLLYVVVAGNGQSPGFNETGAGGFNGGGDGRRGAGGGGGASDLRTVSSARTGSLNSRLLVAPGGGGGGEYGFFGGSHAGGNGGAPGTSGGAGASISGSVIGGSGGGGATELDGGTAGAGGAGPGGAGSDGTAGTLGIGGPGGGTAQDSAVGGGGGGGGGLYGGGGGGAGGCCQAGGGGGGGGSSYVTPQSGDATMGTDATGVPLVSITYPVPTADVTPAAVTFEAQPQGTVSPPRAVTIANNGDAPLAIFGLTFSGAAPGDFLIGSSDCASPVQPGESCTALVRFAPQATGARNASLVIESNAPGAPATVPLSGQGGTLPQGPAGPQGTQGPPGPRGAPGAGLTGARIVCRPGRVRRGRVRIRCRLRMRPASTQARVRVRIWRSGRIVRREGTRARNGTARVSATVRPGRYRVVIVLSNENGSVRVEKAVRTG